MIVEIISSDEMRAAGYPDRAIDRNVVDSFDGSFTDDDLIARLCQEYGYLIETLETLQVIRLPDKIVLRP